VATAAARLWRASLGLGSLARSPRAKRGIAAAGLGAREAVRSGREGERTGAAAPAGGDADVSVCPLWVQWKTGE
jgi:hypothetical protein